MGGRLTMLFSFKGRISRSAYAFVALPVVLVFFLRARLFQELFLILARSAPGRSSVVSSLATVLCLTLLALLIAAASTKRLRDIGWPVFLAAPYALIPFYVIAFPLITAPILIAGGTLESSPIVSVLRGVNLVAQIYAAGLTLILLFFPGRLRPDVKVFSDGD